MTTRVEISCPDDSHWPVEVVIEEQRFDFVTQKYETGWVPGAPVIINPREKQSFYVYANRRIIITEGPPIPQAPKPADGEAQRS